MKQYTQFDSKIFIRFLGLPMTLAEEDTLKRGKIAVKWEAHCRQHVLVCGFGLLTLYQICPFDGR
jgi:hypothetical protein